MKRFWLFFLVINSVGTLYAQDTLFLKNNTLAFGKVTEVKESISYRNGKKLLHLKAAEVNRIRFSDGSEQVFQPDSSGKYLFTSKDLTAPAQPEPHAVFAINTDLVHTLIDEFNIGFEYAFPSGIRAGINLGEIRYNPAFASPFEVPGSYPGTLYTGYAVHPYVKFYGINHPGRYLCIRFDYKSKSYSNMDLTEVHGEDRITFTRSEKATVIGLAILGGMEKTFFDDKISIEFFYGVGGRDRKRDLITTNVQSTQPRDYIRPGTSHEDDGYPTLELGLVVSLNYVRK